MARREFEDPHRAALEWLNSVTGEDMLFYGFKLDVFRIDNSKPAPMYTLVVEPPLWKRPVGPSGDVSVSGIKYRNFWTEFLKHVKVTYPGLTRASSSQPKSWFSTGAGASGFGLGVAFTGDDRFRVELYIDTGIKERNERAFAQLRESE